MNVLTKSYPFAVISPALGTRSETFIYRHMAELLPGQTAVIVRRKQPHSEDLDIQFPYLVLSEYKKDFQWLYRAIRYLVRHDPLSPIQVVVENYLRQQRVSVILSQYLDKSLKWLKVAKKLGIRFFAHAHGYDISQMLRDPTISKRYLQLESADGIITMSEYSRQTLIASGLTGENIYVVPYGINVPDRAQTRDGSNTVRCLAVGRMVGKKAPLTTLKAFRRALTNNSRLTLDYVGDGDLFDEVQEFVYTHKLENQVVLHGSKPNSFVHELMKKADIFLQHSRTDPVTGDEEGLPVAILEAMAHSLPIVSTRHAGIPEAVKEDVTGFLANEGDVDGMTNSITLLANNSGLRNKMGQKGWQRAQKHFSWEKEKMSLLKLFELPVKQS